MNKFITFFISLLIAMQLYAQEQNFEFGTVSLSDFDIKKTSLTENSDAVVLYDIGKSAFFQIESGFEISFKRKTRIKILKSAGTSIAEVEIWFYQQGDIYEKIIGLEANCHYVENGKIVTVKLNPSNIYTEKVNEMWNKKKFAIPGAREGAIIEYKYDHLTPYMFNLPDWSFQWRIPVLYSEYNVGIIPFYEYQFLLQGIKSFTSKKIYPAAGLEESFAGVKYQALNNQFIMTEVPGFTDEEFITSINDYVIKLDFQLAAINYPDGRKQQIVTTWTSMIKDLLENESFGDYIEKSKKLALKIFSADSMVLKTEKEKFEHILNYAKTNFKWNNRYSEFASQLPKKFIESKSGNNADINLFIIGALKAFGIEAQPVISSTRSHGKVNYDYPFSHFFNYVLIKAKVTDKTIITDGTEEFCSNYRIPPEAINELGLIVEKGKTEWIDLRPAFTSTKATNFFISLEEENVEYNISNNFSEYYGYKMRSQIPDFKEKLIKQCADMNFELIDSTYNVYNAQNVSKTLGTSYKLIGTADRIGQKFYISPFLNEIDYSELKGTNNRTYPIDFSYPKTYNYTAFFSVPQGYKIDYTPKNLVIDNEKIKLNYTTEINESSIKIQFNYSFLKSEYPGTDYANLKYYMKEIKRLANERIVLIKE